MNVLLKVIKNFYSISIIFGVLVVFAFIFSVFVYKITIADLNLSRDYKELLTYQSSVLHIPYGWGVVSDSKCDNVDSYDISFGEDSFFSRKIICSYTTHGVHFCIEKSRALLLTIFDYFSLIIVMIIIIGVFVLLHFVLKMYIFTYIWKRIVHIQNSYKHLLFTDESARNCNEIVCFFYAIRLSENMQKPYVKEFSKILLQLNQEFTILFLEKKIPEQFVQEFKLFSEMTNKL